jgi:lipoprotein-anchoring transpeptidase ErfK/SrfK
MRAVPLAATLLALTGCGADAAAPDPDRAPAAAAFTADRATSSARFGTAPADRGVAPAETDRATAPDGRPTAARAPRGRWATAWIVRRTTLRTAPAGRVVARVGVRTEFGSDRVLGVTGRRSGWLRVLAAERPNGASGWIRAGAARLGTTDVSIHVDRSARALTIRRASRVVRRMPVAVGRPDTPTPTGRFAVTDRLRTSDPASPYGCCALALSGHQTQLLPGWPGGDRLAIHGTQNP